MPSSLNKGMGKANSIRVQGTNQVPPGQKYSVVPDFHETLRIAAADLTGANSGFHVFVADAPCVFLGGDEVHATAGTNNFRVKKILAAATSAPGAAADANNVDISANVSLAATANVSQEITPVWPACLLAKGDKVAVASSAGTATLAGAAIVLRFAYQ